MSIAQFADHFNEGRYKGGASRLKTRLYVKIRRQDRRRLIAVFAFIAGALIVCAFCAQQYFTYRSESQTLTAAIRWVDHQLRKVQAVERQPGRLSQAIKGVEEKLSQQRLQVPATLDVGGFLDHFSAMASRFDVEV
ncbi:MAG: hypothetical protein JRF18_06580 [Deltaproteobacteria bacterium]|nr:hypothetical protein [Deltaproteobacteria bacterium]